MKKRSSSARPSPARRSPRTERRSLRERLVKIIIILAPPPQPLPAKRGPNWGRRHLELLMTIFKMLAAAYALYELLSQ